MQDAVQPSSAPTSSTTFTVVILAAAFASVCAAIYAATGAEPSPVVALFLSGGPLMTVILWLQQDARRTGVGAVHDWGYFLLLAWPVVIPWYAFKTRGPSGWRLIVVLFAAILSAFVVGTVVDHTVWGGPLY